MSSPSMNDKTSPTALVIALHGLGMDPKVFEDSISDCLGSAPCIQLVVPEAPTKPVTYLGKQSVRRWFDLEHTPVAPSLEHEGLWESVAYVHELVKKAQAAGIPANRIVLAGFSQGAVIALAAGLTSEHPLAGICAFSGWLPAGVLERAKHQQTPIFMSHGDQDRLIPLDTGLKSAWALKEAGYKKLQFQRHAQWTHQFGHSEQIEEFKAFVLAKLAQQKAPLCQDSVSTNAGSDSSDNELTSSDEEAPGGSAVAASSIQGVTSLKRAAPSSPARVNRPSVAAPPTSKHASNVQEPMTARKRGMTMGELSRPGHLSLQASPSFAPHSRRASCQSQPQAGLHSFQTGVCPKSQPVARSAVVASNVHLKMSAQLTAARLNVLPHAHSNPVFGARTLPRARRGSV